MEIRYDRSFLRDLRQLRDRDLILRVEQVIEAIEAAATLSEISNVRRMTGWPRHYRIRVGNYRLGIEMEGDLVILRRAGYRRDFYRYFPG